MEQLRLAEDDNIRMFRNEVSITCPERLEHVPAWTMYLVPSACFEPREHNFQGKPSEPCGLILVDSQANEASIFIATQHEDNIITAA